MIDFDDAMVGGEEVVKTRSVSRQFQYQTYIVVCRNEGFAFKLLLNVRKFTLKNQSSHDSFDSIPHSSSSCRSRPLFDNDVAHFSHREVNED